MRTSFGLRRDLANAIGDLYGLHVDFVAVSNVRVLLETFQRIIEASRIICKGLSIGFKGLHKSIESKYNVNHGIYVIFY